MSRRRMIILIIGVTTALIASVFFMSQLSRKSIIEELYSVELSRRQMAFVHFGYSSVILRTWNFTIGIDIANLLSEKDIQNIEKMDLLVYTHTHSDHFNAETAREICEKTGCLIAAEPNVCKMLLGIIPAEKLVELRGGEPTEIHLQEGKMVLKPVYGVHPVQITIFVLEADGLRIFHGGDSGYSQSIKDLGRVDIAFLPTGDPSPTASPEDAVKMALDLNPTTIVLFHGSSAQHDSFIGKIGSSLASKTIRAETGKVYVEDFSP